MSCMLSEKLPLVMSLESLLVYDKEGNKGGMEEGTKLSNTSSHSSLYMTMW